MTDDRSRGAAGGSGEPRLTIIRAAGIVLLIAGFGTALFSLPVVFNAAGARCHLSRSWVGQANTDKRDWNNVDTGGRNAKDLPCAEAIQLADQIPLKEKGTKTAVVPGEATVRVQNAIVAVMGLGQIASGVLVLRQLSRRARALALGFSAAALVLVPGPISLGVFAFVAYALAFSPASREIWPKEPR